MPRVTFRDTEPNLLEWQTGPSEPAYVFALLERAKADRKGVTAMEYGVIAASIVIVVATAAATTKVSTLFSTIGAKL